VGTLNDYRYADDPGKSDDSRWVHRPFSDSQRLAERLNPQSIPGRIYQPLLKLIHLRKTHPIFANGTTQILESGNPHVFSYVRWLEGQALLGVVNFSEQPQALDLTAWRVYGLKPHLTDLVSGATIALKSGQVLDGCSFWWLMG
jgi:amylosucrase/maltose alpha-D-glucosyltransferase/alpha-amylase